jgi:hypothetical protein
MLQMDARSEALRTSQSYEAPPSRDRMPTLPEDLSEYAWIHTGPPSWFDACPSADDSELDLQDATGEPSAVSGRLVDLWHSDVPKVVSAVDAVVNEHEARILSMVDGRATIGTLLETSGLPLPDLLAALCELCARGVLTLDRSQALRP